MALEAADRGYVLETGTIVLADDAKALQHERAGPQDLPRRGLSREANLRFARGRVTCPAAIWRAGERGLPHGVEAPRYLRDPQPCARGPLARRSGQIRACGIHALRDGRDARFALRSRPSEFSRRLPQHFNACAPWCSMRPAGRSARRSCPFPSRGPGRCCCASAPAASAAPTCTSSTASCPTRSCRSSRPPDRRRVEALGGRGARGLGGVPWLGWTGGECRYCTTGRENLCDRARFTGYHLDGGYAEYAVADARFCFPIPDGYPDVAGGAAALRRADRLPLAAAGRRRASGSASTASAPPAHIVAQVARAAGPARLRVHAAGRRGGAGARARARRRVGRRLARRRRPRSSTPRSSSPRPASSSRRRSARSRKGGTVVCAGIHMSDIPSFPYELLWGERVLRSVANLTRRDGEEFLALAPRVPVRTEVEDVPARRRRTRRSTASAPASSAAPPSWCRNLAQDAPSRCGRLRLRRRPAGRRDRREPRARAVLRELALRLGRAHRRRPGRARCRLLGRRRAGRPAARRRGSSSGMIALGGARVLAIPVIDEPVLEAVVDLGPGPAARPARASIAALRAAERRPRGGRRRSPSGCGRGRVAERRRDRRSLFAVSTAGSIAGTFATAFFLDPGVRHRPAARARRRRAARAVAFIALASGAPRRGPRRCRRRTLACVAARARARARRAAFGGGGRNWSPLYRLRGQTAATRATRGRRAGPRARLPQGHALPPARRRRGRRTTRYLRFDNSLQSAMYLDDPFRTRFRYTDLFHLGLAYDPARARCPLHRPRRRVGAEADAGATSRALRLTAVELDPVVVDVAYRFFALPRRPAARVEVGDGAPLPRDRRCALRRDRHRRVLRGRDPVPPRHAGVPRARAPRLAPGGVVVMNVIGAIEGRGSKLFRSIYRRTAPSSRPSSSIRRSCAATTATTTFRNLILVATDKAASREARLLADRWAASGSDAVRAGSRASRSSTGTTRRSRSPTCRR